MEGILLIILALVQVKRFSLWKKMKADSNFLFTAFVLLVCLGTIYFGARTFLDLGHIDGDLGLAFYRPLLVDLRKLATSLLQAGKDAQAGWTLVALRSYQGFLALLGLLNLSFLLFRRQG